MRTRPRRCVAVGEPAGQLLINGERGLDVAGVELGAVPEPQVRVPGPEQRDRRVLRGGEFVGDFPKIARRLHVVAELKRALGAVIIRFRELWASRRQLETDALEYDLRPTQLAVVEQIQHAGKIDVP